MQTGFEIDGESESPGVSTIRSMNSALPEVRKLDRNTNHPDLY